MKHQSKFWVALLAFSVVMSVTGSSFAEYKNDGSKQQYKDLKHQGGQHAKREEWKKNHPEAQERMSEHKQKREEWKRNHPEAQEKMAEHKQKREEWKKNHPEAQKKMAEHKQKREEWKKNHLEAQERMSEHKQKREEWMKNHPEARKAMSDKPKPGKGHNGQIPGHAYGNNQTPGNGGQMGNSNSPHRD